MKYRIVKVTETYPESTIYIIEKEMQGFWPWSKPVWNRMRSCDSEEIAKDIIDTRLKEIANIITREIIEYP